MADEEDILFSVYPPFSAFLSYAPYAHNTHLESKANKTTGLISDNGILGRKENEPLEPHPARKMKLTE